MTKNFKYLFILTFLLVGCDKKENTAPTVTPPGHTPEPHFITDRSGNTFPTGVPIPIKGSVIHPDSIAKPVTIPLQGSPKVVPAHDNVRLAGKPKILQPPSELKVVTPGEDSIPLPKKVEAKGKVVPAVQQPPIPGLPLRFVNAGAVKYNIKYLEAQEGLSSAFVSTIYEDSRGHLWFGTSGGGVSRYDGVSFTHYAKKEGLSYTAQVKLEDSQGNLWLKLDNGVARYDGQAFTTYTEKEGFNGTGVSSIIEDGKGDIWFGTSKGASRYEPGEADTDGVFTHFTDREGLANGGVRGILEDKQGRLWFGTNQGAYFYDGVSFSFTQFFAEEGSMGIKPLMKDSRGHLWFGTTGSGVIRYDGTHFFQYTTEEGLAHNYVNAGLEDDLGNIWLGTNYGISCFDGTHFTNYRMDQGLSYAGISGIGQDGNGNLWFGTMGFGVNRLDIKKNFMSLVLPWVLATHVDKRGNIWFGSFDLGVICYDGKNFTYYTEKEGLISNQVRTIAEDSEGALWFGTGKGASRYVPATDGTLGTFTNYTSKEGLSGNSIYEIVADKQGNLWFGFGTSGGGLCRYEPDSNEGRGKFVHYTDKEGMPDRHAFIVVNVDHQDNLWFNNPGGATYFDVSEDGEEGILTYYSKNEGLIHEKVRAIIEDQRHNIWFGTHGGVCYYDGDRFRSIPLKEGWWQHSYRHLGRYNSLLEDHLGRIWVSRERALSLLVSQPDLQDLQNDVSSASSNNPKDHFQIYDFGIDDGLMAIGYTPQSVSMDDKDRIFWGGRHGSDMLDLTHFELPAEPPKVYLNHIQIEGQSIDFRRLADSTYRDSILLRKELSDRFDAVAAFYNYPLNMELPHDLNHITFHFTGIDWAAPEEIKYSYLLEGLDNEWSIPKKENKADYQNIPPGNHTLKVKAIGAAQEWSEVFEYTFTMRPPWYWAWWSKTLYLLLFLGGLYSFYQFQLKRRLAAAETRRLKELDQVKTKLYTNITHEFRTPLTIINGMAKQLQAQVGESAKEGLAMIHRNGQQLLRLINQMLDLSKLESGKLQLNLIQGNIIPYLRYVIESFHSFAELKNIRLHFHSEEEELIMDHDPENMLNVISNFLSNAIKFTEEGGDVYINLTRETINDSSNLIIQIRDTGIGISEDRLPDIFDRFYQVDDSSTRKGEGTGIGLALTKELVKLMNGDINVNSKLGKGTAFTISLPITQEAKPAATDSLNVKVTEEALAYAPHAEKKEANIPISTKNDPYTLLIVEDNIDVVKYLLSCLEGHYQLEVAYNGQEGIEKALEIIPDIIVSDVMMPDKDGFELCDYLKNDEKTSHIPIVLLTAKVDIESKIAGLKRGADAYIPKPFDQEELLVQLENLIQLRKKLQARYQRELPLLISKNESLGMEDSFLQKIKNLVETHSLESDFDITKLAYKAGMSRVQLFRKIKALTGKSPSIFVRTIRLQKAKMLLLTTKLNISEITYEVGFNNPAYFSRIFKEEYGKSPTEFLEEKNR